MHRVQAVPSSAPSLLQFSHWMLSIELQSNCLARYLESTSRCAGDTNAKRDGIEIRKNTTTSLTTFNAIHNNTLQWFPVSSLKLNVATHCYYTVFTRLYFFHMRSRKLSENTLSSLEYTEASTTTDLCFSLPPTVRALLENVYKIIKYESQMVISFWNVIFHDWNKVRSSEMK